MSHRRYSYILLAFVLVAGLFGLFKFLDDPVIAKVGKLEIRRDDVDKRDAVVRTFYPNTKNSVGLVQLIRSYTSAQIMENYGYVVTEEMLRAEIERIDAETRDPETLAKIKKIFGQDRDAYTRIYILPTFIDRTFYERVFLRNSKIQEKSVSMAKQMIKELGVQKASLSNAQFSEFARKHALPVLRFTVSATEGFRLQENNVTAALANAKIEAPGTPDAVLKELGESAVGDRNAGSFWLGEISRMKRGEIAREPFDFDQFWLVVRYEGAQKGKFVLDAIAVPKIDFEAWYQSEKAKVPVTK